MMRISNLHIFLGCLCFVVLGGCLSKQRYSLVASRSYQVMPAQAASTANTIEQAIHDLTSPDFFRYTQAARKLVQIGMPAVIPLYQQRHRTRSSYNSDIPVMMLVIKLIYENATPAQLEQEQQNNPYLPLRQLAAEVLQQKRRSVAKVQSH